MFTPVSAVPVFPATWMPGICAAVPVPAWTTETIIWLSAAAGWGVIAYGVRGAFQHHIDTNPRDLAWFFFGGALVHDLVFAPLLLLGGVLVARAVPARARAPRSGSRASL